MWFILSLNFKITHINNLGECLETANKLGLIYLLAKPSSTMYLHKLFSPYLPLK